jgi:transcriptional regulator with XRE-family HTH domain
VVDTGGVEVNESTGRVGDRLRQAREAAGLDLKQLSQRTKVTLRHLAAIEAGDYAELPGKPYAIGFSKSYARAVGLDGNVIADAVRAELRAAEPSQPARAIHQYEIGDPVKTPSSRLTWLAATVAVAVVILGFALWRSYYWPAAGLPPVTAPAAVPAPAAPPQQTAVQPNGPVTFTALDQGVWVKFYDAGGTQLLQKELARGESYTLPAEADGPKIWTGRPEALAITIGGQPVPKLAEVQMTIKDVPVSAAALLARAQAIPAQPVLSPGPTSGRASTARSVSSPTRSLSASPAATGAPAAGPSEADAPPATGPGQGAAASPAAI